MHVRKKWKALKDNFEHMSFCSPDYPDGALCASLSVCVCVGSLQMCTHSQESGNNKHTKTHSGHAKCAVTPGPHVATKLSLFRPFVLFNDQTLKMVTSQIECIFTITEHYSLTNV